MARASNKLSALLVSKIKGKGRFADGGGLYLQVSQSGGKSWILRYMLNGKAREMGLGSAADVSLADARKRAAEAREALSAKIDPLAKRTEDRAQALLAAARAMTFNACCDAYIEAHDAEWRNAKHRQQWRNTLATYAGPVFGGLPVAEVDRALIMKALEPIWKTKTETASRLRGRIEAVLDWATVRGFRTGENPARWKGGLSVLLASPASVRKVRHHPALPFAEIGEFMTDLRKREATAARVLEFLILTAARTGEAMGARWGEFDLGKGLWTVPAERMKAKREHRVPLSRQAVAILAAMMPEAPDAEAFVFPGNRKGKPLSEMALLMLLRRMERGDLTAHGFRSTFRDWVAEATAFPGEIAEAALAHVVGDKVEAAYRRGDLFEKRARLMQAWADYCDAPPAAKGSVTPLRRKAE